MDDVQLVLASTSARRRDLLRAAGIAFEIDASSIDERIEPGEPAEAFARRMAHDKAMQVAQRRQAAGDRRPVLGADTIVVIDEQVIGKPTDRADARRMLLQLSARTHRVITGFCVVDGQGRPTVESVSTDVQFKTLGADEVERYLDRAAWADKAGAYAVQEHAAYMVRSVAGSYTNVVGLPLCEALEALARVGVG